MAERNARPRATAKPPKRVVGLKAKRRTAEQADAEFRAEVRRRDAYRCRCCTQPVAVNAVDPLQRAEVHHLVKRSQSKAQRRDVENGITLCAACHALVESHEIEIRGDRASRATFAAKSVDARRQMRARVRA